MEEARAVALTGIHFLLTYRCTRACPHCFVYSSPGAEGTMTLAQIREVYAAAEELGTVNSIYFEGGEPFLFYPVLVQAAREARERSWSVGVVTNGYWAESEADAELWLRPLAALGLGDLSVSCDAFHGDPDSPRCRHALAAGSRLGIPSDTIAISPESDRVPGPGEPVRGGDVMYRGRAAAVLAAAEPQQPPETFTFCPHETLDHPDRVHVDAAGYVHLCQGLALGNLQQHSLVELIRTYDPRRHPIVGPLLAGGPWALARAYDFPVAAGYADACHLCYSVRRWLRSRFTEVLGPGQVYGLRE